MRIPYMPKAHGDLPCNAPCQSGWCRYNQCGLCVDSAPCEDKERRDGGCADQPGEVRQ